MSSIVNLSRDSLVFNDTDHDINTVIRSTLRKCANLMLQYYGCEDIDLDSISASSSDYYGALLSSKYILNRTLKNKLVLGNEYIQLAFNTYMEGGAVSHDGMTSFFLFDGKERGYRTGYNSARNSRKYIGLFLSLLHYQRIITLPYSYKFPFIQLISNQKKQHRLQLTNDAKKMLTLGRSDDQINFCISESTEILKVLRSIDPHVDCCTAPLISMLSKSEKTRLSSQAAKLVLAMGWSRPDDVNIDDLKLFVKANKDGLITHKVIMPYRLLLYFLIKTFKDKVHVSKYEVELFLGDSGVTFNSGRRLKSQERFVEEHKPSEGLDDSVMAIHRLNPSKGSLKKIGSSDNPIPWDSNINISNLRKTWITIEDAFLQRTKKGKPQNKTAVEHLNLYLFYYLPLYFKYNPDSDIGYPDTPNKFIGPIFVSRLTVGEDKDRPMTYIEFIAERAKARDLDPHTHGTILRGYHKFSSFIARWRNDLPESDLYEAWFYKDDMPILYKYRGTNKEHIPRKVFPFVMQFWYALSELIDVSIERVVQGNMEFTGRTGVYTDGPYFILRPTSEDLKDQPDYERSPTRQSFFGFIPVVFYKNKVIPIFNIPRIFITPITKLKDGRTLRLPQPHGIYHCITALETGLRNNHIQWLDLRSFDKLADPDEPITKLLVNTDKVKSGEWTPFVTNRVIKLLNKQKKWRELIDEPSFNIEHHYNLNSDSGYAMIKPLFSSYLSSDDFRSEIPFGTPHSDSRYETTWQRVLESIQGYLVNAGFLKIKLIRLIPPNVRKDSKNLEESLRFSGDTDSKTVKLRPVSDISPHSARVTVCSHLITVLSPSTIGEKITGHGDVGSVYHYVRIDDDDIDKLAIEQAHMMRHQPDSSIEATLDHSKVKASHVNSELSKAIRNNPSESIANFGCFSIVAPSGSGISNTGVQILQNTNGMGAVVGDTEICPHGYICPAEIIKSLKGLRKCALCPHAVRSVDHLDAIAFKKTEVLKDLKKIESILDGVMNNISNQYSEEDIDSFEQQLEELAAELSAWHLVEEILEIKRMRMLADKNESKWHIHKPEILKKTLIRRERSNSLHKSLLEIIDDASTFPKITSPTTLTQLEVLRRQLIANTGGMRAALTSPISENPASECATAIRVLTDIHKLSMNQIIQRLDQMNEPYHEQLESKKLLLIDGNF